MRGRPKKEKPPTPSLKELLTRGDLISPEELAAGLRVARVTVYQWANRGVIPCLRIEGVVRFDPETTAEWLKGKACAATKSPGRAAPKEST